MTTHIPSGPSQNACRNRDLRVLGGMFASMILGRIGLILLVNVPTKTSIPAAMSIHITTLWFAIGLSFLAFPFAEKILNRGIHGLEKR